MKRPILITGIGTEIGKTLVAAIITEALQAGYWKPVQAGYAQGTDTQRIKDLVSNDRTVVHPEAYCLKMPASPHIAAAAEGIEITVTQLATRCKEILQQTGDQPLVLEGAGGLLVPVNATESFADLAKAIHAKVVLVSRNYLGSINHSRLTAYYCQKEGLDVVGWIFNDQYLDYEDEIVAWSGYPSLGRIPRLKQVNRDKIKSLADTIQPGLHILSQS